MLRAAVGIQPANAKFRADLAAALAKSGQLAEADSQARQALILAPNNADAHYVLGVIYDQRGNRRQAIDESQQTLAISPQHAECVAYLQRLTSGSGGTP